MNKSLEPSEIPERSIYQSVLAENVMFLVADKRFESVTIDKVQIIHANEGYNLIEKLGVPTCAKYDAFNLQFSNGEIVRVSATNNEGSRRLHGNLFNVNILLRTAASPSSSGLFDPQHHMLTAGSPQDLVPTYLIYPETLD